MVGIQCGVQPILKVGEIVDRERHRENIALRRRILLTLYDFFQDYPLAEMELSQLEASCRTSVKTLNWNLVYLEKKGLVDLSPAVECLPYVACTASIAANGIDLVENEQALQRLFPL